MEELKEYIQTRIGNEKSDSKREAFMEVLSKMNEICGRTCFYDTCSDINLNETRNEPTSQIFWR